jgi:hypothetical protein
MKAEERAAGLVKTGENPGGFQEHAVVVAGTMFPCRDLLYADWVAESIRNALADALEAHAAEAVAEALREGLRDAPVAGARVEAARRYAEWLDGGSFGEVPPEVDQPWHKDVLELCSLVDHLQARVALMAQDGGWRDGYEAGRAEARRRGLLPG